MRQEKTVPSSEVRNAPSASQSQSGDASASSAPAEATCRPSSCGVETSTSSARSGASEAATRLGEMSVEMRICSEARDAPNVPLVGEKTMKFPKRMRTVALRLRQ